MSRRLRLLQIEDSEGDAALIVRALERAGYEVQSTRVETADDVRAQLQQQVWDLIIADYRMPELDAPTALSIFRDSGLDIPFLVISGTVGEEQAVKMMRSGAHDYLMKDALTRLGPAVERELNEARVRKARREAEHELRMSQERLKLVLAAAGLGVWEWNLADGTFEWSPECLAILGELSPESGSGEFERLVHEEDLRRIREAVQRAIAERGVYSEELRIRPPSGELRWISNFGMVSCDPAGRPLTISGTVQDITARKRTELALRDSEERFRALVERSPVGIFVQTDRRFRYLNPAAVALLGASSADELVNTPVLDRAHPNYRDLIARHVQMLNEEQTPVSLSEKKLLRMDGSAVVVEITAAPFLYDGRHGAIVFVTDISERKRTESALEASERRWQYALEGSGDGVWDMRADTGQIYYSRQWKAMLGYEEAEIGDNLESWQRLVHPEDHERVMRAVAEHRSGQTPTYSAEYRMRCKDGSYKWILSRGAAIERAPNGQPLRIIGTHTDLTQLKKAEAEREKLRAQFLQAQKMESIGRLAGGVAHDFNNLLTVINGYSEMLLNDDGPIVDWREAVEQIRNAGERAASLVRQLLEFSRKSVPSKAPMQLNTVVRDMGKMIGRLMGESVEVVTHFAGELGYVLADQSQLEQVLLNLVVNARDAMAEGGTLTIATEQRHLEGTCPHCMQEIAPGPYVLLTVRDTGTGMTEATKAQLFEPFFTTKDVGKGTGLGLAVVHGIVHQLGGHLSVHSALGVGSEFQVALPVASGATPPGAKPVVALAHDTATVLVVEDEAGVRDYTVAVLRQHGYRVLQAATVHEALELLGQGGIDVMLTDLVMPGRNGGDLALEAQRLVPALKILFMSGYSDSALDNERVAALKARFIAKPFSALELSNRIAELLHEPGSSTPAEGAANGR